MPRPTIIVNHLLEPPNRITGITRYLFALLPELLKRGDYEYVLLTAWDRDSIPPAIADAATDIVQHRYHNSMPLNVVGQMATVRQIFRKTGAVLEFNCNPVGCSWPLWPRVITLHDLYFDLLPKSYSLRHRSWWRLFFPLSLAACTRAICVSNNTKDDLQRFYPNWAGKGIVVHEAGILNTSTEAASAPSPLSQQPYALFVGNISPNKAPGVLAQAMAILQQQGHAPNVYHIGRDDAGLLANAIFHAGGCPALQSVGTFSDADLAAAYANAKCLIVTSSHEGFCLPVLEAQSFATPIVCSDIPVLREVAGDGAMFFQAGSPADLARRLEQLFASETIRHDIGRAARRNAARFSWAKAASETERIFNEIVREKC